MGNTIGSHLSYNVCDIGMPIPHSDVYPGAVKGLLEKATLCKGPLCEWWRFDSGFFVETNLSVTMLKLFDNLLWECSASGDLTEILGHFAKDIGSSMGEE
jgi:hypothetical protein